MPFIDDIGSHVQLTKRLNNIPVLLTEQQNIISEISTTIKSSKHARHAQNIAIIEKAKLEIIKLTQEETDISEQLKTLTQKLIEHLRDFEGIPIDVKVNGNNTYVKATYSNGTLDVSKPFTSYQHLY